METLLFIAIAVVITIIQKKMEKTKEQQNRLPPRRQSREQDADESESQESQGHNPPRSLQDLIRQFEEAQRQATQGNMEPPTPPVEPKRHRETLTLRDIAEVVIGVDFINLEFLMEEFEVDENTAAEMLMDLQAHRIVGRDMGEGDCDVLVHDIEELDNLLSHESHQQDQGDTRESDASEFDEARQHELDRQRELNALEERARQARESAAALPGMDFADSTEAAASALSRKPAVSAHNHDEVRKGFIWAKVLDEPRFKRRWSPQYR